ncbi:MAG: hypothetical protein QOE92_1579, partial [Chloroflexota bacterium]|nr:hypothetical protein [Chloroflexota bacterium]
MANGPALVQGQLVFPLNKGVNSVGRRDRITNTVPDVDLSTLDQERAVSRKHAEAVYNAGRISLRDLGSTNGTFVNGEQLALQVERELNDGDRVSFGGFEVAYASDAEWPPGVEPEYPSDEPEATTIISPSEETAVVRPSDETAVFAPGQLEAAEAAAGGDAGDDVYTPPAAEGEAEEGAEGEAVAAEDEVAAEGDAVAAEAEAVAEPAAESEPTGAVAASEASLSFVPCTNHPHLPAVGLCPGCLDPFCIDCLPERAGQPLACTRCAGIQLRLGAMVEQHAMAGGGYQE